jgi:hypothetical protein
MIPISPKVKLAVLLILVGGLAALQAIQPLAPTWAWIAAVVKVLSLVEAYLTVPGGTATELKALRMATKVSITGLLLLTLVTTQVACPAAAPAAGPSASCVSTVVADALKGMTLDQILADAGPGCVKDAAEVYAILSGSPDPQVPATKAFGEAKARKAGPS